MTIRRDDLRKTDFSDVSNGKRLAPVHPGDVSLKDFIEPMGISRYRVAKNIHVPQRRIDLICRGDAAVSAEMALRLGRLFGTTPEFWINLQAQHDLEVAARATGKEIAKAVVPLVAAPPHGRAQEPKPIHGFRPLPKRGGIVTNELIDKLREDDAY